MLDEIHIEHYRKLGLLPTALQTFKLGTCCEGTFNNLVGAEFEMHKAELERAKGNKVETEVKIDGTRVDIVVNDTKAIECKCRRKINNKVVKQLKKYKRVYPKVTLFVCKDTKIKNKQEIQKYCTIERAEINKKEIVDRVLELINNEKKL